MKQRSIPFILLIFLILLLFFPIETLDASKTGLLLWFNTLLPSLLPFLIISQLIMKTEAVSIVQKYLGPLIQRIFHCSKNGTFCILCGFLCGYPVGARLVTLGIKDQKISLSEGEYLMSFCNNVSPMFCISYGILFTIQSKNILPYIFIIYGSSLLYGFITRPKSYFQSNYTKKEQTSQTENLFQLIDVCIIDSFLIMIKLCGCMILFSILSTGILLLLPENMYITAVITCILEISGGLSNAALLTNQAFRNVLTISALSFGGLCCLLQTNTVICETNLSLKNYTFHKIRITLLTLFLFCLWKFLCSVSHYRC